jgi:hypothetical protein
MNGIECRPVVCPVCGREGAESQFDREDGTETIVCECNGYKLGEEEVEVTISAQDAEEWGATELDAYPLTITDPDEVEGIRELIGPDPISAESLISVVEANDGCDILGYDTLKEVSNDPRLGKYSWVFLK